MDISVPAFPAPVKAAKIESVITQAGALGDPFGSGLRTVWWVYGVGPVKVLFQHTSGEASFAQLQSTNLAPLPLPSDANLLPLALGAESQLPLAQLQAHEALVRAAARRSRRRRTTRRGSTCSTPTGPIDVNASYVFSNRLGGLTNITTVAAAREHELAPAAAGPGPRARRAARGS